MARVVPTIVYASDSIRNGKTLCCEITGREVALKFTVSLTDIVIDTANNKTTYTSNVLSLSIKAVRQSYSRIHAVNIRGMYIDSYTRFSGMKTIGTDWVELTPGSRSYGTANNASGKLNFPPYNIQITLRNDSGRTALSEEWSSINRSIPILGNIYFNGSTVKDVYINGEFAKDLYLNGTVVG